MTKISNQYSLTNVLFADAVNGRVGIGTASPTVPLDVVGAGKFSGSSTAAGLYLTTDNALQSVQATVSKHTVVGLTIRGTTASVFDFSLYSAGGTALITNPTGTNNINFNSGQVWFNGGNVGIGTSSPLTLTNATTLHINGTSSAFLTMGYGGTRYLTMLATSGYAAISTTGATPLTFETNEVERMRITSAGNVGIGITAPSQQLSVEDTILIKDSGSSASQLIFGDAANDFAGRIFYNHGSDAMQFFVNADERMRITSGGNVLIGTTTDNSTGILQINGTMSAYGGVNARGASAGLFTQSRNSADMMGWYAENTTYLYYYHTSYGATGRITASSGVYTAISDINKKKNFEQSNIGLNEVMQLKPTLYHLKTDDDSSPKELGFIAQEVKELIPQAYSESEDGNGTFIGLNQMPIIAALTKAIQELKAEIDILKNK